MNERENQSDILAKICKLQTEAVLKEMEELQYEINHPPKSYIGKSYDELRNEIKQRFRYKEKKYSGIVAVFCNTKEEFDFVKYFYTVAHSSSCNIYNKIKIDAEYSGPDWYFYETEVYGNGYGSSHWMETLTQKKQKFAKFVAEYE